MATIENVNSRMFAAECNDIYVAATDDVAVQIQVETSDGVTRYDQTGVYTPVDGVIGFGDLADLVNKCILLMDVMQSIDLSATELNPHATLTITLPNEDPVVTESATVYYCTAGNISTPSGMIKYPSQASERRCALQERVPLWVPFPGDESFSITLRCIYVYNDEQYDRTFDVTLASSTADYLMIDAGPKQLVRNTMGSTLFDNCELCEYWVHLWNGGVVTDTMHFRMLRDDDREVTTMLMLNIFGLPESVLLAGREEENHSLEADFGFAAEKYIRLDTAFTQEHVSNTGWLLKKEKAQMLELYRSPVVEEWDGATLRPVTVTDIDVSLSRGVNEPMSFDVTWRYQKRWQMFEADVQMDIIRRNTFDSTFDYTFD